MRNRIERFLIMIIPFIMACQGGYVDNQELIREIDRLEYSELRYELETDSLGNVIDTLELIYYKYDDEHNLLFREREIGRDSIKSFCKEYYCAGSKNCFFQESQMANGKYNSVYEAFFKKCGLEEKTIMLFFDSGSTSMDTIEMFYERSYDLNRKIKELVIAFPVADSLPGSMVELIYNDFEKPEAQYFIHEKDTTEYHRWFYSNDTVLTKYIFRKNFLEKDLVETSYLNDLNKVDRTEIINEQEGEVKKRTIFYNYDEEKNIRQRIEVDSIQGLKKYYSYVYVDLLK